MKDFFMILAILLINFSVSGDCLAQPIKARIKYNIPACVDNQSFSDSFDMIIAKDFSALAQLILSGKCIVLDEGETVYFQDTALLKGQVKIRKRGETNSYWTLNEAVEVLEH